LRYLQHETETWLEITTLLIPGENDSEAEIESMTQWIVANLGPDVPLHFTAFFPSWKMMEHPPTPFSTLNRSRRIALRNGMRHVYTGNVHDPLGASTYCHVCGEMLIGRSGYDLSSWSLSSEGRRMCCSNCGTVLAGVFDGQPGDWGSRRQPVRID